MIKLIGILIIVVGFIMKFDTIAVVVLAGIVTGLVSGMSFNDIVATLGKAFVENRYMSIFIISLPVIGILERYGLRERAAFDKQNQISNFRKTYSYISGYKNTCLDVFNTNRWTCSICKTSDPAYVGRCSKRQIWRN